MTAAERRAALLAAVGLACCCCCWLALGCAPAAEPGGADRALTKLAESLQLEPLLGPAGGGLRIRF